MTTLLDLIATAPTILAQAESRDYDPVLVWLNDPTAESTLTERFITDRTVLAEVINPESGQPDPLWANTILDKMDAIATQSTLVKRAMNRLYADGLDIGSPATQAQLDMLVGPGGLTQAEADALKALGVRRCSRAEKHTGRFATLDDLWSLYP